MRFTIEEMGRDGADRLLDVGIGDLLAGVHEPLDLQSDDFGRLFLQSPLVGGNESLAFDDRRGDKTVRLRVNHQIDADHSFRDKGGTIAQDGGGNGDRGLSVDVEVHSLIDGDAALDLGGVHRDVDVGVVTDVLSGSEVSQKGVEVQSGFVSICGVEGLQVPDLVVHSLVAVELSGLDVYARDVGEQSEGGDVDSGNGVHGGVLVPVHIVCGGLSSGPVSAVVDLGLGNVGSDEGDDRIACDVSTEGSVDEDDTRAVGRVVSGSEGSVDDHGIDSVKESGPADGDVSVDEYVSFLHGTVDDEGSIDLECGESLHDLAVVNREGGGGILGLGIGGLIDGSLGDDESGVLSDDQLLDVSLTSTGLDQRDGSSGNRDGSIRVALDGVSGVAVPVSGEGQGRGGGAIGILLGIDGNLEVCGLLELSP